MARAIGIDLDATNPVMMAMEGGQSTILAKGRFDACAVMGGSHE